MFKVSSRAATLIIIATVLLCAAILVGKGIAISFADKSDGAAVAKQIPTPVSKPEAHLNNSEASVMAIGYFEPFWLLVLGATLLAIGASLKRIVRAEAKTDLPSGKSGRAL